jgi:quinol monooxygenase YgiN
MTVLEIAQIDVKDGEEAAFEAAVAKAVHLFQRAKGCRGMRLHRSVEVPTRYRLVVKWDHLEDHTVHLRGSADFQDWRRLVGAHFASPPAVEHTNELALGF